MFFVALPKHLAQPFCMHSPDGVRESDDHLMITVNHLGNKHTHY